MKIIPATQHHVAEIVELLRDDFLGKTREGGALDMGLYRTAFSEIDADPNNTVYVTLDGEKVIGCLQLTFIAGLSRTATKRAQIEAVRVHRDYRNQGIGEMMFDFAIAKARKSGCKLVQLTTAKERNDAHRFYDRFGFEESHIGYKLAL